MNLPKVTTPERTTIDFKASTPSRIRQVIAASGYLKPDMKRWVISDRNEIIGYDPNRGSKGGAWSQEQMLKCAWHLDKISNRQALAPRNDELDRKIDDLFEVLKQEAKEDGSPLPEQSVFDKVRHFIKEMGESPDEIELDLFDDSSIGITKHGAFGCSVMTVCKPDGTAITALSEKGEYHHLFSSSTDYRPDVFVRFLVDVLDNLEKESIDVVVPSGDQQ